MGLHRKISYLWICHPSCYWALRHFPPRPSRTHRHKYNWDTSSSSNSHEQGLSRIQKVTMITGHGPIKCMSTQLANQPFQGQARQVTGHWGPMLTKSRTPNAIFFFLPYIQPQVFSTASLPKGTNQTQSHWLPNRKMQYFLLSFLTKEEIFFSKELISLPVWPIQWNETIIYKHIYGGVFL